MNRDGTDAPPAHESIAGWTHKQWARCADWCITMGRNFPDPLSVHALTIQHDWQANHSQDAPNETPSLDGVLWADKLFDRMRAQLKSLDERIAERPAAKVTMDDIEAEIMSAWYFTAAEGVVGAHQHCMQPKQVPELARLTFCVLVLRNGFTVTGESACANPINFDAQIGRDVARAAAVQKVWTLLGFALRNELSGHRPMATTKAPADAPHRVTWSDCEGPLETSEREATEPGREEA
jgi:hypothetical protein